MRTHYKSTRHLADTTVVPDLLSTLRKEITKRKLEWLFEVVPYICIITGFLVIYLIHNAIPL